MQKTFDLNKTVLFNNNAAFCIGTGRMNLALRREYYKQLKETQKDIGFSYIRGHGLFCDDMAVYHTYTEDGEEKVEYNFSYIDLVFDSYLELGLKPFVELGFMPGKLASGEQTIFYWKGNTTPPKDYDKWADLVTATVNHWIERYGIGECLTWLFEVWNEPNLGGFWKDADMAEYFKLYEVTARAVKKCNPGLRVGGPSICGVDDERWMRGFLEFCRDNAAPLDFITRHAYGTEEPQFDGHYVYQKLRPPEGFMEEPLQSRAIIDSFPEFKGMDMHITEFNTSYNPRNLIHDTNLNAAYIARLLSELGDSCASYSYWTFGDVFEEMGVAFTPFSGCFGLITNGMIKKPTYWTFVFYKKLYKKAVYRDKNTVITANDNGDLRGVMWNLSLDGGGDLPVSLKCGMDNGAYFLLIKTVDEQNTNPLKVWMQMGQPPYPNKSELEILRECAKPVITTKRIDITNGGLELDFSIPPNAVVYFELRRVKEYNDRGFDAKRI